LSQICTLSVDTCQIDQLHFYKLTSEKHVLKH